MCPPGTVRSEMTFLFYFPLPSFWRGAEAAAAVVNATTKTTTRCAR